MRLVRIEGITGTALRNMGWLSFWNPKTRPVADLFQEVEGRPVRPVERALHPDMRRTRDRDLLDDGGLPERLGRP
jgi:hypothetical protein